MAKWKEFLGIEMYMGILPTSFAMYQYLVAGFIGLLLDTISTLYDMMQHPYTYIPFIQNSRRTMAPLLQGFDAFYQRRMYGRIFDCWSRPVLSAAGAHITIAERRLEMDTKRGVLVPQLTGESRECINLGSYNYLGFGDNTSPCIPQVIDIMRRVGISTCSTRSDLGTTPLHIAAEEKIAKFVGKESAMIFGMGFATNSTGIPSLFRSGDAIISDSLNHTSIVVGCRLSGAKIFTFKHGDTNDLEQVLRKIIVKGQPQCSSLKSSKHSYSPWKRIIVMVEGIYSMEGDMPPLRQIVALKKKYKFYLYVDEAHSIGALGASGRGICEQAGVNPQDVDILMGTFTKSIAAVGGYIASSRELIALLKQSCAGYMYSSSLTLPACAQVIAALDIIQSRIGLQRITSLHEKSTYFRNRLKQMGLHVLGDDGSPVVPVLLVVPTKIPAFSRLCLERNLAVVVVGFPATPILSSRTRFCISAAHSMDDIDFALEQIEEVVDLCHLRYHSRSICVV